MHMRSVTRKAAVTAGLGVALAAAAAGSASATSVAGFAEDLVPAASQARSALPDTAAPFSLTGQVVDRVPVAETLAPGHRPVGQVGQHMGEQMGHGMEQSMGNGMAEGMTNMAGIVSEGKDGKGGVGGPLGNNPLADAPAADQLQSGSVLGDATPLGNVSSLGNASPLGNASSLGNASPLGRTSPLGALGI